MRTVRFLVSGRVQGVGYRYYVLRQARALAVEGWVRNLPDGRVEAVACGDDPALSALEGRLWEGPPAAVVSSVEATQAERGDWAGFSVLPTPWVSGLS